MSMCAGMRSGFCGAGRLGVGRPLGMLGRRKSRAAALMEEVRGPAGEAAADVTRRQ